MKAYTKLGKNVKFGDIEIQKQRFHLYKEAIVMESIDTNKIVVSNKIAFRKKGFKYFIGYKDDKKNWPYVYFYQKWVHIEKSFIELNICVFWYKMMNYKENIMKFRKKLKYHQKRI